MKTIIDLIEDRCSTDPEFQGFNFITEKELEYFDYATLRKRILALAAVLQQNQSKSKDDRILILLPPTFDFVVAMFACLYAGVIAVPAFPPVSDEMASRIMTIIKNAEIRTIITNKELAHKFKLARLINPLSTILTAVGLRKIKKQEKIIRSSAEAAKLKPICIDEVPAEMADEFKFFDIKPDRIAYLQYTSGSTSHPKGVILTHQNLLANLAQIQKMFKLHRESTIVNWLPPYHDMGLICAIFTPIYCRSLCYSMSPFYFLKRPINWLHAVTKYRGTLTGGPDFAFRLCIERISEADLPHIDLSSLDVLFSGAEKIQADTLMHFKKKFSVCKLKKEIFLPCYGLAEAVVFVAGKIGEPEHLYRNFCASALKHHHIDLAANEDMTAKIVTVGKVADGTKMIIRDCETNKIIEDGRVGEICITGDSITPGYWHNQADTENAFFTVHGTKYLKTGDLGFLHYHDLYIVGRIKELIIIYGKNHYPYDIEMDVGKAHEKIKLGRVVAFSTEKNNQENLVVIIELNQRSKQDKHDYEKIASKVKAIVSRYHQLVPSPFVIVQQGSISKTSSGKLKRAECKRRYLANELEIIYSD